ncbi:DMT family transporter [Phormidium tenue]|uniref:EamA family transporter n=1 Tax=Phormidium tenue NIES-30 TaxID=549789 RepID=A0A1U7J1F4_9CYAN|nr:EamA family transporter [Phormidium tenue]MBD2233864.1 EamA family transporter [Phormidium tenue FACHB-1052]OKH45658.1 EamA family transporter [Phormidium tenue NIES-30]
MDSVSVPQSVTRNPIVLIAPFFLWGTAMVAMKGAMPHTTPFFMAGVRLVPAGLLVLLVGLFLGRSQTISRQGWLWIALFALVDGTLFQGFLAAGLQRTGAGLGSVMIDSQPLAVAVMARGLFGEYIGALGWIGLMWGIAGISLLGLPDEWIFSLFHGDTAWLTEGTALTTLSQGGEWLMLLAALSMATGTILIRYVCRHVDPVVATGWHMVLGGIPLFVLSSLEEVQPWQGLTGLDWGAIAYSTIFGSALAYGIFFFLAAQGNLTSLSALTFLTPVFALLFGNLFLGETLSSLQWLGVSFTLVSIYLINQRDALTQKLRQLTLAYETATSTDSTPVEPD